MIVAISDSACALGSEAPPSITMFRPVRYPAASEHRNVITAATSSADPTRCSGVPLSAAASHPAFDVTSAVSGVAMRPGDTQFTRIVGAYSSAAVIVRFTRPAFAAEYGASPDSGRRALSDELFTMLPPAESSIRGITARMQLNAPGRFTAMTFAHSPSG